MTRGKFESLVETNKIKFLNENLTRFRFLVCKLAKNGFYILTASADHSSYMTFASAARALQLPLINWALPPTDHQSPFEISMRPPVHALAGDVIMAKHWSNVIYIYDGPDGNG